MAARYGRYGVRANAVAPGSIRTAAWDERVAWRLDLLTRLGRWFPLGRVGTPDEVAACVLLRPTRPRRDWHGAHGRRRAHDGQVLMADELLVEEAATLEV